MNIFNLFLAAGWFIMTAISLITQHPFEWYVSALMCAALAINYTADYLIGKQAQ